MLESIQALPTDGERVRTDFTGTTYEVNLSSAGNLSQPFDTSRRSLYGTIESILEELLKRKREDSCAMDAKA